MGSGHEAALKAFQRIVKPAAVRFAPDIILVRTACLLDSASLDHLMKGQHDQGLVCVYLGGIIYVSLLSLYTSLVLMPVT